MIQKPEIDDLPDPRVTSDLDLLRKADSSDILSALRNSRESVGLRGAPRSSFAYLAAQALRNPGRPVLLVAPTDAEAEKLVETVSFFLSINNGKQDSPMERRVWHFPSRTGQKIQSLGKMAALARRIETLYAIRTSLSPLVIVTSALALLERLPPPGDLVGELEYLVPGETVDLEALSRRLVSRGYYRVSLVEEYGDFGRRGGVTDVFAPLYRWPLRLEFYGDELESIRLFHPSTQRSMGVMDNAVLLPSSEVILDERSRGRAQLAVYDDVEKGVLTPAAANAWLDRLQEGHQLGALEAVLPIFYDHMESLFDYLDRGTLIALTDTLPVRREVEERYWNLTRKSEEENSPHEWKRPPEELYQSPDELWEQMGAFQQIRANSLEQEPGGVRVFDLGARGHDDLVQSVKSHPARERLLEPLARQFREWQSDGIVPFLVCRQQEQARRLSELLEGYGVDAAYSSLAFGEESYTASNVKVLVGTLDKGFTWEAERLAVVSEQEIFGSRARRKPRKTVAGLFLSSFQDLHVGDFIVHVDHGIGVYKELAHLNVRGVENDFLLLEYQDGDRLYVPVDKLYKVQKYLGLEGQDPKVEKLGGRSWEAAKTKAREAAEVIAGELLNLYALRQLKEGHRFSAPDKYFREFEATFQYDETPDQLAAIQDVLDDMGGSRPMDRLICGDVGYGKTEVALRAAFKAVMDGKQVAILVPTTVLAEQHSQSFQERFEGFPVIVETLSRFKTAAQQKQIIEKLKKGTIDIVIGTHRLIQKDVAFRDLGLLVIDEEHRFGVKHKEKIKQLRVSVDVLTLTATPIPRTLHMSLAGIRDLSTIDTAPQDRHAIETFVCRFDDAIVRDAIVKEIRRGGQVFFVHNQVRTIYQMAGYIGRLVPEARIAVAHGQMHERDLEKVMLEFIRRKTDVLVCTTIIESGLDIPAANTIIIDRADKLGLAQIYQLRGRVGRSSQQAFAYLLIPGEELVSRDAQKRLRALLDFSELGAGFKIALNDLQIRGGGTILGSAQSGQIAAVGYEYYLELLERTIRSMKGGPPEPEPVESEIGLAVSAFLPESFIPDTDQRLIGYKRLAGTQEDSEIEEIASEWRDRYGPFPVPVRNLVLLAKLRLVLKRMRVARLDGDEESFTLQFAASPVPESLCDFLERKKVSHSILNGRKLKIEVWARSLPLRLAKLKRVLQEAGEHASDAKSNQQVSNNEEVS